MGKNTSLIPTIGLTSTVLREKRSIRILPPAPDAREGDDIWAARLEALRVLAVALVNEIDDLRRGRPVADVGFSEQVARFEAELIRSALIQTGGRQRRAARLLGMKASTLHRKIKLYGLDTSPHPDTDAER